MAITNTILPQIITPSYNPVVFGFTSNNYLNEGFRYVVDIFSANTNTKIASLNVVAQIAGDGYVNISKILSNFLTVTFDPNAGGVLKATDSYLDYTVKIGEEYNTTWPYNDFEFYAPSGFTVTQLRQSTSASTHTFIVGDQINVTTANSLVNGLHTVVGIVSPYSILIEVPFVSGPTISGTVQYADNRKTTFSGLTNNSGYTVTNSAFGLIQWPNLNFAFNSQNGTSPSSSAMLTNLPVNNFYATPAQNLFINFAHYSADSTSISLEIENSNGDKFRMDDIWTTVNNGSVRQVPIGPNNIYSTIVVSGTSGIVKADTEWYKVNTISSPYVTNTSQVYTINIDRRCVRNDYHIAFMDRKGSVMSFAFQLSDKETGSVQRESFKQQLGGINGSVWSYLPSDRGTTITNIDVTKSLELNTNWMTDEMSVYFEELITSPYLWFYDGVEYISCFLNDSSFEVERQKNKRLIKKTISITFANNTIINI